MKLFKVLIVSAVVIGFVFAVAFAAGNAEKGKALFSDAKLLGVQNSCSSCHPDGKGLEKAGAEGRTEWKNGYGVFLTLEDTINVCIIGQKGKVLDPKSEQMQDLIAFFKSLSVDEKK